MQIIRVSLQRGFSLTQEHHRLADILYPKVYLNKQKLCHELGFQDLVGASKRNDLVGMLLGFRIFLKLHQPFGFLEPAEGNLGSIFVDRQIFHHVSFKPQSLSKVHSI